MAFGPPASCRACLERLRQQWPAFRARGELLLARQASRRIAGTRIVTTILRDLFTSVLDWPRSGLHAYHPCPGLVVSSRRNTCLLVEARAPHSLRWDPPIILAALARLGTSAPKGETLYLAISDGIRLYVAQRQGNGLEHRIYVSLVSEVPPAPLWWLSQGGIHRPNPSASFDLTASSHSSNTPL